MLTVKSRFQGQILFDEEVWEATLFQYLHTFLVERLNHGTTLGKVQPGMFISLVLSSTKSLVT